jgi:uncharacterized protein (TIGR04255 family)
VKQSKLGKKLICKSQDETKLVQLTGRLMAVNQLRPYMGWEEGFRSIILDRWAEVMKTSDSPTIQKIVLRYINRIEINQSPLHWDEWFNYPMPFPNISTEPVANFQMGFNQPLSDTLSFAVHIANAQNPPPGVTWVILDITVILEEIFPGDTLEKRLEMIHGPHSSAFELYIKDSLRAQFGNSSNL